jgi:hypothetical protein
MFLYHNQAIASANLLNKVSKQAVFLSVRTLLDKTKLITQFPIRLLVRMKSCSSSKSFSTTFSIWNSNKHSAGRRKKSDKTQYRYGRSKLHACALSSSKGRRSRTATNKDSYGVNLGSAVAYLSIDCYSFLSLSRAR